MKKSGQENNMFGMPVPGMEMFQPQAMMESCSRMAAQMEDLGRTMVASMQRSVESAWDLSAQLARTSSPTDATRLCRDWMDERREAAIADGRQISAMMLKMYELRPAAAGSGTPVAGVPRAASAAE